MTKLTAYKYLEAKMTNYHMLDWFRSFAISFVTGITVHKSFMATMTLCQVLVEPGQLNPCHCHICWTCWDLFPPISDVQPPVSTWFISTVETWTQLWWSKVSEGEEKPRLKMLTFWPYWSMIMMMMCSYMKMATILMTRSYVLYLAHGYVEKG